jgi:hypothetical protein
LRKIYNISLLAKMMLPLLLMAVVVLTASAADLGFGAPSIQITSPSDGTSVPSGDVTINVHVDDLTITDQLGGPNVDGQGHILYFMDAGVPTTFSNPAFTSNSTTVVASPNTSYTWTNVMPGTHRFAVELVNNDNTPLNPPKYAMVNLTAV